MVWGMVSMAGPVFLVKLKGKIKSEIYRELLEDLLPYLDRTSCALAFQEDNALVHRSQLMNKFDHQEETVVGV